MSFIKHLLCAKISHLLIKPIEFSPLSVRPVLVSSFCILAKFREVNKRSCHHAPVNPVSLLDASSSLCDSLLWVFPHPHPMEAVVAAEQGQEDRLRRTDSWGQSPQGPPLSEDLQTVSGCRDKEAVAFSPVLHHWRVVHAPVSNPS